MSSVQRDVLVCPRSLSITLPHMSHTHGTSLFWADGGARQGLMGGISLSSSLQLDRCAAIVAGLHLEQGLLITYWPSLDPNPDKNKGTLVVAWDRVVGYSSSAKGDSKPNGTGSLVLRGYNGLFVIQLKGRLNELFAPKLRNRSLSAELKRRCFEECFYPNNTDPHW